MQCNLHNTQRSFGDSIHFSHHSHPFLMAIIQAHGSFVPFTLPLKDDDCMSVMEACLVFGSIFMMSSLSYQSLVMTIFLSCRILMMMFVRQLIFWRYHLFPIEQRFLLRTMNLWILMRFTIPLQSTLHEVASAWKSISISTSSFWFVIHHVSVWILLRHWNWRSLGNGLNAILPPLTLTV